MLTEKTKNAIIALQKRYPEKRSALIPALHLAQGEKGYLPQEIQEEVARLFGIDANEVNAVVTFYDMFFDQPTGKQIIHVCKNLSCMLRGADGLLSRFCRALDVHPHEVTKDGEFMVIASECLAACDRAPVVLWDETLMGPVKEGDVTSLLQEAKKCNKRPPKSLEDEECCP